MGTYRVTTDGQPGELELTADGLVLRTDGHESRSWSWSSVAAVLYPTSYSATIVEDGGGSTAVGFAGSAERRTFRDHVDRLRPIGDPDDAAPRTTPRGGPSLRKAPSRDPHGGPGTTGVPDAAGKAPTAPFTDQTWPVSIAGGTGTLTARADGLAFVTDSDSVPVPWVSIASILFPTSFNVQVTTTTGMRHTAGFAGTQQQREFRALLTEAGVLGADRAVPPVPPSRAGSVRAVRGGEMPFGLRALGAVVMGVVLIAIGAAVNAHYGPTSDLCATGFGALVQESDSGEQVRCGVADFAVAMHWPLYVCGALAICYGALVALGGRDD